MTGHSHTHKHALSLPHFQQSAPGYCLSACVRMILTHLGLERLEDAVSMAIFRHDHSGLANWDVVVRSANRGVVGGVSDADLGHSASESPSTMQPPIQRTVRNW